MSFTGITGLAQEDGLGPRTSHQFVKDRLRRAIVRGELSGGTRLIQNDIASEFGVSTTPVREALRDLATEGLIRLDAHRGAIVHEVDAEEFAEIYEMRLVLEPLAVRRAIARITDEALDRAEQIQDLADQETDPGRWVEYNRSFHAVFVDAARSERLSAALKMLRDSSSLYVGYVVRTHPDMMAKANLEHHAILDAFRRRDEAAAVDLAIQHLHGTHDVGTDSLPHDA